MRLLSVVVLLAACKNEQAFIPKEWPDLDADHGKWLSMDVAPDGSPVMAFQDVTQGALGFAVGDLKSDGRVRWSYERVDGYPDSEGLDSGNVGAYASMKVAKDGTVWVAYKGPDALRVAHRVGGAWSWEMADAGAGLKPDAGHFASLALDADGNPVVAHHDEAKGTLRVARRKDGAWTSAVVKEGVAYDGVDDAGNAVHRDADVGEFCRIVIDGNTEYIAYYDKAQQSLGLLEGFAGAYGETIIDDNGDVGQWPSLLVDGDTLYVAYQDVGNQDLRLATRSGGGSFSTELVDSADYVGSDTELYTDGDTLGLMYFDGRNNDMKVAKRVAGAWTLSRVGAEGAAVGFFNETVSTRGHRYFASYDYTNKTLYWKPE